MAVKPSKYRNPQLSYLCFLSSTFSSNSGRCSRTFSSILIEYVPVVLWSVFCIVPFSVFLNQEWNRLTTNIASTSESIPPSNTHGKRLDLDSSPTISDKLQQFLQTSTSISENLQSFQRILRDSCRTGFAECLQKLYYQFL